MRNNLKQIFIILITSIILMLPLYFREYKLGDDTGFHVANITATKESIKNFMPNDILPNIAKNFGYASRQFYPILSHTVTSYLSIITTLSVTTSLKIVHTIVLFLSGLAMYFLALKLSKDKKIALLSSIIYITFPYQLAETYVRDALAESFIFIFIPIILNSLTEIFKNNKKFIIYFTFGYVLGMLSHLTMMIYLTILLIPFFLINYKKVFKKENLKALIISCILILTITSPVLLTMIQNKLFGNYQVFAPGVMAQYIQHSGLWLDYINYFGIFNSIIYNSNGITFYFNIIVVILFIYLIIKRKQIDFRKYKYIILFTIASLIASSIIFPWDLLPETFRIIQFPWRFMTFVSVGVSILVSLVLPKIKFDYRFIIIIIVLLATLFDTSYFKHENLDTSTIDYSYGLGWQKEYLPVNTYNNLEYFYNRNDDVLINDSESLIEENNIRTLKFTVTSSGEAELPRIFYYGYNLYNNENNLVDIYENDKGFIAANLTPGSYTLKYEQTKIVQISNYISIISIIIFIVFTLVKKQEN